MAEKLSMWVENTEGKREIAHTSNFSFSHSVFKRLILQTRKNQGLFGKGQRHEKETHKGDQTCHSIVQKYHS